MEEINKTIFEFGDAADNSDISKLDNILDNDFRLVLNRMFGSDEIVIINKATYLKKIRSGEWGGQKRQVNVEWSNIKGNTASAMVSFTGKDSSFSTFLQFAKNQDESWKIVNDMPSFD